MQSSYANFGVNPSISVSPYQIPGMIQAYTQPTATDNGNTNPIISQNDSTNSALNMNANPSNASCFHSSKSNSNSNSNSNNNNNNNNNSNNSNNNNNALTLNSVTNNQNNSTTSSVAAASLYQNNPFDLQQQSQLYAHQRLLQAQQQHQQTNALFPDYAAVMARYGAYH